MLPGVNGVPRWREIGAEMSIGAKALALSATMIVGAAAANAASVTFNLQDPGGYVGGGTPGTPSGNSLSLTSGGLTANFSAFTISGDTYDGSGVMSGATVAPASSIFRYNNGLGSRGTSGDPQHSIDAVGDVEFVQMSFSDGSGAVNVQLTELIFGWVGGPTTGFTACSSGPDCHVNTGGAFELILDTVDGGIGNGDTRVLSDSLTPGNLNTVLGGWSTDSYSFLSGPALIDSTFGVKAGNDGLPGSWKLRSVTVETIMTPPPPEVIPLPAAAWLLIGGLGSLVALRRRR